jgi:hypothetical protein
LSLRYGLRQHGIEYFVQLTQRLSLVPRCGTREHTGLTCGRAYGALSIADRRSIGATKSLTAFLFNAVSAVNAISSPQHRTAFLFNAVSARNVARYEYFEKLGSGSAGLDGSAAQAPQNRPEISGIAAGENQPLA